MEKIEQKESGVNVRIIVQKKEGKHKFTGTHKKKNCRRGKKK